MIEKTVGIVLRVTPVTETSHVVHWMTEDFGKIATLVKGAQRPRSQFLGQYDSFYTCEILFYAGRASDLHIARECAPLKRRDGFRRDWRAAALASYLADLISQITLPHAPAADVFRLLDDSLDFLAARGARANLLFWFELRLMGLLGWAPLLTHCVQCGAALEGSLRPTRFSHARGGLLCAGCANGATRDSEAIPPDVVAMLCAWQKNPDPTSAFLTRCLPGQAEKAERFLGLFERYHLDARLTGRDIALDLLR